VSARSRAGRPAPSCPTYRFRPRPSGRHPLAKLIGGSPRRFLCVSGNSSVSAARHATSDRVSKRRTAPGRQTLGVKLPALNGRGRTDFFTGRSEDSEVWGGVGERNEEPFGSAPRLLVARKPQIQPVFGLPIFRSPVKIWGLSATYVSVRYSDDVDASKVHPRWSMLRACRARGPTGRCYFVLSKLAQRGLVGGRSGICSRGRWLGRVPAFADRSSLLS